MSEVQPVKTYRLSSRRYLVILWAPVSSPLSLMVVQLASTVACQKSANGVALVGLQVVFHLHPTFPNPHREVTQHPFEIEESGWGEFDIQISVRSLPRSAVVRSRPVYVLPFHALVSCVILPLYPCASGVSLGPVGIVICWQVSWRCLLVNSCS